MIRPSLPMRAPHPPAARHRHSWAPRNDEGTGRATEPAPDTPAPRGRDMEAAGRHSTQQTASRAADLPLQVGAMGAGLALIGLGLGFLGLRLRRTQ